MINVEYFWDHSAYNVHKTGYKGHSVTYSSEKELEVYLDIWYREYFPKDTRQRLYYRIKE